MSQRHRIAPDPADKPAKPCDNFPLFAHNNGCWAKKIRGRLHYFGPWAGTPGPDRGADAALAKYLAEKDDLHAGRTPREAPDALTVFTLCGKYLTTRKRQRDAGELTERTFQDYTATCQRVIKAFGRGRLVSDLRPECFETLRATIARQWGPIRLGNEIARVRTVFNYAFKSGMLDRPMVFGEGFRVPSKRTLRAHRAARGPKMFEADEIRRMLRAAGQPLRTMILLAVNCGFGNADCGTLPLSALDLAGGWVNYHRPKTGISRRCPLWPETVAALKEWLPKRPEPRSAADVALAFITKYGQSWHKDSMDNPVSKETRKLLDALGINGRRGFYALRHTFQTIGDEGGDFIAVRAVMGHADSDISSHYRERISDERLAKVTSHVHVWLFGSGQPQA
jgi:integrase